MDDNFNEDEEFSRIMKLSNEQVVRDLENTYKKLQLLREQIETRRLQMDNKRVEEKLHKTQHLNKLYEDMLRDARQKLAKTDETIAELESKIKGNIKVAAETQDTSKEQPSDDDAKSKESAKGTDTTPTVTDTSYTESRLNP